MTEKQKFIEWVKREKRILGLLDIRFSFADPDNLKNVQEEELYAELNRLVNAPTLEDKEIF